MTTLVHYNEPVFYVPGRTNIIDTAVLNQNGEYVGEFTGQTIEEIDKRYPNVALGEFDAVIAEIENLLISAPQQITQDQYEEALETLPPQNWVHGNGCDSFKMCEYTSGSITAIYARRGKQYFCFQDKYTTSHESIMAKVNSTFPL